MACYALAGSLVRLASRTRHLSRGTEGPALGFMLCYRRPEILNNFCTFTLYRAVSIRQPVRPSHLPFSEAQADNPWRVRASVSMPPFPRRGSFPGSLTLKKAASWSSRKSCLPACFQGIRNMVLAASSQHTPGKCPLSTCSTTQFRSFRVQRALPDAILGTRVAGSISGTDAVGGNIC